MLSYRQLAVVPHLHSVIQRGAPIDRRTASTTRLVLQRAAASTPQGAMSATVQAAHRTALAAQRLATRRCSHHRNARRSPSSDAQSSSAFPVYAEIRDAIRPTVCDACGSPAGGGGLKTTIAAPRHVLRRGRARLSRMLIPSPPQPEALDICATVPARPLDRSGRQESRVLSPAVC